MMQLLFQTEANWIYTFLRIVAGIIIFPYGMQKLLGWFSDFGGGVGIRESLTTLKNKGIPKSIAWLVIFGQSLGSIALIIGFFGRFAAIANFIIFIGALVKQLPNGWTLNWMGKKNGEGIEYFILLLAILFVITLKGSGPLSIDHWLFN